MHQNHSVVPEQVSAEKKQKRKPRKRRRNEKMVVENNGIEVNKEEEQQMFAKLRNNAELLTAILNGNLDESADFVLADLRNVEATQTAFTRRQGDKVIACLGNLAETLEQLCDLVQGSG